MNQIDQGDEGIADAKQPEIVISRVPVCVTDENKKRKGDRNGEDLDEAVEQQITVEAAEVQGQGYDIDGTNVRKFEHLGILRLCR